MSETVAKVIVSTMGASCCNAVGDQLGDAAKHDAAIQG